MTKKTGRSAENDPGLSAILNSNTNAVCLVGKSWDFHVDVALGISNEDKIVIYDNSDVLSACRGWYNFIYFGHDKHLVSVLDGGLKKWLIENRKTTNEKTILNKSTYKATENKSLVKNIIEVNENIEK